mmetsp:Transcript_39506/g.100173  ORF Transcript_39506/g.100173 Transcript_39506/m.100173 type:complete len:462 (-) Transcript_39506:8-1393(-)
MRAVRVVGARLGRGGGPGGLQHRRRLRPLGQLAGRHERLPVAQPLAREGLALDIRGRRRLLQGRGALRLRGGLAQKLALLAAAQVAVRRQWCRQRQRHAALRLRHRELRQPRHAVRDQLGGHAPDKHAAVAGNADQARAVRRDEHARHDIAVTCRPAQHLAGVEVVQPHRAVRVRRGQRDARWVHLNPHRLPRRPRRQAERLHGLGVLHPKHLQLLVLPSRNEVFFGRLQLHVIQRPAARHLRLPHVCGLLSGGLQVAEHEGAVRAAAHQPVAAAGKPDRRHGRAVLVQRRQPLVGPLPIVHVDQVVAPPGRQQEAAAHAAWRAVQGEDLAVVRLQHRDFLEAGHVKDAQVALAVARHQLPPVRTGLQAAQHRHLLPLAPHRLVLRADLVLVSCRGGLLRVYHPHQRFEVGVLGPRALGQKLRAAAADGGRRGGAKVPDPDGAVRGGGGKRAGRRRGGGVG